MATFVRRTGITGKALWATIGTIAMVAAIASSAQAGLVIDLRNGTTNGANFIAVDTTAASPSGSVTLNIYAVVTNAGGTPISGDYNKALLSFYSSNGGLVYGNMVAANDPAFVMAGNLATSAGTPTDLDGDSDIDVGSTNNALVAGWFVSLGAQGAYAPVGTEGLVLGTVTFTYTGWATNSHGTTTISTVGKTGSGPSAGGAWKEAGVGKLGQPTAGQGVTIYGTAVARINGDLTVTNGAAAVSNGTTSLGTINTWSWDLNGDGTYDVSNGTGTLDLTYADLTGTYGLTPSATPKTVKMKVSSSLVGIPNGNVAETTQSLLLYQLAQAVASGATVTNAAGGAFHGDASVGTIDTWSWDLNNDGTFDATNGTGVLNVDYAALLALGLTPSGTPYSVKMKVSNSALPGGNVAEADASLTLYDLAQAVITGNVTVADGAPGTVFGNTSTGTALGTWSFDFNNDGVWDLTNNTGVADVSFDYLVDTLGMTPQEAAYVMNMKVTGAFGNESMATGLLYLTPVPEPATLALLGLGGLALLRRRRQA